ncbi:MAG: CoA-binding protein [Candidatus Micrarchaeota archaeon]|nr:CoA-binding protein [Candidatus Micrarchaeota archaeon]
MEIQEILEKFRVVAVVGCSRDPSKPAHYVPKYLLGKGYTIIPVNPSADAILGQKCYKSLGDIPQKVDVVDVFRPSSEALDITRQAVAIGAKVVWLQEGITSTDAGAYAMRNNVIFVQDKCMMKQRMKIDGETFGGA